MDDTFDGTLIALGLVSRFHFQRLSIHFSKFGESSGDMKFGVKFKFGGHKFGAQVRGT